MPFVRPGDPGDLADGLVSVLSQADALKRMSRSARILAESRYSPEAHLSGLLRVLNGAQGRNTAADAALEG